MVKIEHKKADLKKFAREHYDALMKYPYSIDAKLLFFTTTAASLAPIHHGAVVRFLKNNLKRIIVAEPENLERVVKRLKPRFDAAVAEASLLNPPAKGKSTKWETELEKVFNYKSFVRDKKKAYFAYTLAEKLKVNVCPYCNRQYTFTINKKSGKTRPEFDHFFNKSSHPYLAVSFFNLIPSCHICNANLKRDAQFTPSTHLNPYDSCFSNVLNFYIGVNAVDFVNGQVGSFTIQQVPALNANPALVKKAEANAKVFLHSELYNNHQDLVVELLQKAYHYTPSRRKELAGLVADITKLPLFKTPAELDRFITGAYTQVRELGKRPMSKLITDIGKELKLLK